MALNCSTDSSPQNVLTRNIALGQEASYTVLIDLHVGLTELRNVRDSAAPRSYIRRLAESGISLILGRGPARLEAT